MEILHGWLQCPKVKLKRPMYVLELPLNDLTWKNLKQ